MATGKESLYNYNNGLYSANGYPFSGGQLKLQASYSSSIYDASNLQSMIYVNVTLYNIGIDWGYSPGREVNIYWNDSLVASFNPPNLFTSLNVPHVSSLGTAAFPVQHQPDGTCTGTLKVEWNSVVLAYTVSGQTINVTELGCKASVVLEPIQGGVAPTDVFMVNGTNFLPVLKEDLAFTRAEVNRKSVITMDGTEWAKEKVRHKAEVKLMDMSAEQYAQYASALATNPGSVTYTDAESGIIRTGTFYFTDIKHTKHKVMAGVIYLAEISFNISEKTAT